MPNFCGGRHPATGFYTTLVLNPCKFLTYAASVIERLATGKSKPAGFRFRQGHYGCGRQRFSGADNVNKIVMPRGGGPLVAPRSSPAVRNLYRIDFESGLFLA